MMTSREEVFARLREILVDSFELEASRVTLGARLRDDLDLDSIDAIDLAARLEGETGLELDDDEVKAVRRVEDVVALLHAKLSDRATHEE